MSPLDRGLVVAGFQPDELAIAPVADRSVDQGFFTRFQVYASEHDRSQYTPKLAVQVQR